MKKYNCIVVFNAEKTEVLFCKRTKNPYKGLYNFVGGKVEDGENSTDAAYRELFEETGIEKAQLALYHLMDFTYYQQDFILEIFVGRLMEEIILKEEANPLVWLPLTEDFTDSQKYAGEQNIAHIINMALKYPLEQSVKKDNSLCIGVDGCKGGWIVAVINNGNIQIDKFVSIEAIVGTHTKFDSFLIDMVIGFPNTPKDVRPDTFARKIVSPRTSTVFAVPCREAVYADTEEEQICQNVKRLGKGLAKQTMAIIPKMRELDKFLNRQEQYKNQIRESHPEVCFARLNGSVVMSKKGQKEGMVERVNILKEYLPVLTCNLIEKKAREFGCNQDDIVDAVCLAVTGWLSMHGQTEAIPPHPQEDACGLKMQMIIPKERIQ